MKYITPDFYQEFHCIADQCPDTCCAGWEITIDRKSIDRYQKEQGPFGNRLHNSIDWNEHTFLQYDHKCIFLNENNLCDLYTEAGADSLCQTCKQYPRHSEAYQNVRELSIAISCPEVARMLLTRSEKIQFVSKETKKVDAEDVTFPTELFQLLNDARQVMFDILQNRTIELKHRISLVLGLGHDVQKRMAQRQFESMSKLIEHYKDQETQQHLIEKLKSQDVLEKGAKKPGILKQFHGFHTVKNRRAFMKYEWNALHHLDALNKEWPEELKKAQHLLSGMPIEEYNQLYLEFYEANPHLSIQIEQLMVYFIFGYTNGAVYDGEFYSKVKFAVFNTLAIEELFFAAWVEDGYLLHLDRQIEVAHKYAREIEHLDDNIEYLDETLRTNREFALDNMIRCLK